MRERLVIGFAVVCCLRPHVRLYMQHPARWIRIHSSYIIWQMTVAVTLSHVVCHVHEGWGQCVSISKKVSIPVPVTCDYAYMGVIHV